MTPQVPAADGPSPHHASGNETPNEGVASAVRAFFRHPDAGKKTGKKNFALFWVISAFGLAALIVLGGYRIGGGSQSPDPVKSPTTTEASMSLAEAYCSDLRNGMSPLQIWRGVKDEWPDVGKLAVRAYHWAKRECPSELKSNEPFRIWLENWDINPDA